MEYRYMTIDDYDKVNELWHTIRGFVLRSLDDSREGIERFLKRNPDMSIVAFSEGRLVGALLCGHDGRRGGFYHVCVHEDFRNQGIASHMVRLALDALKREGINKINLIAFKENEIGNRFWKGADFTFRGDLNYYDHTINPDNIFSKI